MAEAKYLQVVLRLALKRHKLLPEIGVEPSRDEIGGFQENMPRNSNQLLNLKDISRAMDGTTRATSQDKVPTELLDMIKIEAEAMKDFHNNKIKYQQLSQERDDLRLALLNATKDLNRRVLSSLETHIERKKEEHEDYERKRKRLAKLKEKNRQLRLTCERENTTFNQEIKLVVAKYEELSRKRSESRMSNKFLDKQKRRRSVTAGVDKASECVPTDQTEDTICDEATIMKLRMRLNSRKDALTREENNHNTLLSFLERKQARIKQQTEEFRQKIAADREVVQQRLDMLNGERKELLLEVEKISSECEHMEKDILEFEERLEMRNTAILEKHSALVIQHEWTKYRQRKMALKKKKKKGKGKKGGAPSRGTKKKAAVKKKKK